MKTPCFFVSLWCVGSLFGAEADLAATAVNTLGLQLHRQLPTEGNLCTSPYSIQTALAMTYLGASGQTQAEMAQVLRFPADKLQLGSSFNLDYAVR
jgi:serpin B